MRKTGEVEYVGTDLSLEYNKDVYSSELKLAYGQQDNYDHKSGQNKSTGDHVAIEQFNAIWLNSYSVNEELSIGGGLDYRTEKLAKATLRRTVGDQLKTMIQRRTQELTLVLVPLLNMFMTYGR